MINVKERDHQLKRRFTANQISDYVPSNLKIKKSLMPVVRAWLY